MEGRDEKEKGYKRRGSNQIKGEKKEREKHCNSQELTL